MSNSGDFLQKIGFELLIIIISFFFGLLMRRKVGRFLIRTKKRLLNDPVSIDIVSVRTYTPVRMNTFDMETFHNLQKRIPNIKLDFVSDKAMRIGMPPFGTLKIILTAEPNVEQEEEIEEIKVSLSIENPIRLGIRQIDLIHEYYHSIEIVFQVIEDIFVEKPTTINNYAIAGISRVGGLLEEKSFEIKDDELSARIQASPEKITIMAKPPNYIARAVKKYLLV